MQAQTVERNEAAATIQPSPELVKRERRDAAARAEDQRLGIRREPSEDIVSQKAVNERQAASRKQSMEQRQNATTVVTWETLRPGDKVTLYRGESAENTKDGNWWTTSREKAAQYGAVRSFTADAIEVAKIAVQGHGGKDEFFFPEGVPDRLLRAEPAKETAVPPKSKAVHRSTSDADSRNARQKLIVARWKAIAEDKELGIVRPRGTDPLSPAAVKQREAVRSEKEFEAYSERFRADMEAASKERTQKEQPSYTRTGGKGGISRF
jgi:hypothetical protein